MYDFEYDTQDATIFTLVMQTRDAISQLSKKALSKVPNLTVQADAPRWAYIQALFSRGDRRVADILAAGRDNQWNWARTFKSCSIDPDFYVHRQRDEHEVFPWDFIDHGMRKSFLLAEYKRAQKGKKTRDCDPKTCTLCGVCPP